MMLTYFSYLSAVNQISSSNTALLLLEVVTVYLWIQASFCLFSNPRLT